MRVHITGLNDTVRLCGLQSAVQTDYLNLGLDPAGGTLETQPWAPTASSCGAVDPKALSDLAGPTDSSQEEECDECFKTYRRHLKFL